MLPSRLELESYSCLTARDSLLLYDQMDKADSPVHLWSGWPLPLDSLMLCDLMELTTNQTHLLLFGQGWPLPLAGVRRHDEGGDSLETNTDVAVDERVPSLQGVESS